MWCLIHLLNGHILSITVCPEVCTGTSPGHGVWQLIMKGLVSCSQTLFFLHFRIDDITIKKRGGGERRQSGYGRLEEGMVWRQSTVRKAIDTGSMCVLHGAALPSLQLAAHVELVGVLGVRIL